MNDEAKSQDDALAGARSLALIDQHQYDVPRLLIDQGLVDPVLLRGIQAGAVEADRSFTAELLDVGVVDEDKFTKMMVDVTNLPLVDPREVGDLSSGTAVLSADEAKRTLAVVLRKTGTEVVLAVCDPTVKSGGHRTLAGYGDENVRYVLSTHAALLEAIERAYA